MYRVMLGVRVERLITTFQKATQAKYERLRILLVEYGPNLGMPHSRRLTNNLYELRIRGTQEIRFFCITKRESILVFHGFIKKTQKIPKREMILVYKMFDEMK